MKRMIAAAILVATLTPADVHAWHRCGHMSVARVAWDRLVKDGLTDEVTAILEGHPHKDVFLLQDVPAGISKEEWMFVQAATWPDWVRSPHGPGLDRDAGTAIRNKYSRPAQHFINLPYIHPADAGRFDEAAIKAQALAPEFDAHGNPRHAVAALKMTLKQLQAPTSSAADRAVALCWILHLTGDLHQPLHAITLIGSESTFAPEEMLPPHGDEGGNRLAVREKSTDHHAIELHTYWDALIVADKPYPEVRGIVVSWLALPELQRSKFDEALKKKEAIDWAEESLALGKSVVYMDGGKFLDTHPLPPSHSTLDLRDLRAPVLPAAYQKQAEQTARQRMVLGGYRLGDILSAAIKPAR